MKSSTVLARCWPAQVGKGLKQLSWVLALTSLAGLAQAAPTVVSASPAGVAAAAAAEPKSATQSATTSTAPILLAQASTGAAPATAAAPGANTTPAADPFQLVPEPKPDDSNAVRAKTQPGNNAPFWRGVRESGDQPGYVSLPGAEKGVLVQRFVQYPGSTFTTAGEAWRQVRNNWIIPYGGSLLLIVALSIAIFYWTKGPLGHATNDRGRHIERFTAFERAAHWSNATAFVLLAISGLVMAFGKFFLLPVLGGTLFGWLSYALKNIHNFVGPLFAVSLLVVIVTFARDNLPRAGDWEWLRKAGGLLGGKEVPSHRFNAGEKVVFWGGVFLLGLIVVVSGLVLDKLVPGLGDTRGQMQVAHMVHAVAAVLMAAMFAGHIYIGTIGMKGAYKSMRTGHVDEAWAKEHHEWWYDDIKAGKISAQRSAAASAVPATKPAPAQG